MAGQLIFRKQTLAVVGLQTPATPATPQSITVCLSSLVFPFAPMFLVDSRSSSSPSTFRARAALKIAQSIWRPTCCCHGTALHVMTSWGTKWQPTGKTTSAATRTHARTHTYIHAHGPREKEKRLIWFRRDRSWDFILLFRVENKQPREIFDYLK